MKIIITKCIYLYLLNFLSDCTEFRKVLRCDKIKKKKYSAKNLKFLIFNSFWLCFNFALRRVGTKQTSANEKNNTKKGHSRLFSI